MMAKGYYMTSKVKIPKRDGGNYIAGVRYNRIENDFHLVLKDSSDIEKKFDIGNKTAFVGYLAKKFAFGRTGIDKKILSVAVSFLIQNRNLEITKQLEDFY